VRLQISPRLGPNAPHHGRVVRSTPFSSGFVRSSPSSSRRARCCDANHTVSRSPVDDTSKWGFLSPRILGKGPCGRIARSSMPVCQRTNRSIIAGFHASPQGRSFYWAPDDRRAWRHGGCVHGAVGETGDRGEQVGHEQKDQKYTTVDPLRVMRGFWCQVQPHAPADEMPQYGGRWLCFLAR
jgi:hypothetical protein